ncbi:MAG TPA: SRPBCC domain-containing protein, partial [Candidatus Marinimicrobia bacterium]|nr:SRPBCC domain-containing protein [Candidatus Neomarinimicrobiota bacterium]
MENRVIHGEILINSSVDRVWDAWTTESGIKSF